MKHVYSIQNCYNIRIYNKNVFNNVKYKKRNLSEEMICILL